MPTLILVRHAAAEERDPQRWPDDSQRPLTRRGRRRFAGMLRAADLPAVDRVMASGYERAWRTAEILCAELGLADPERSTALEEQGVDAMRTAAQHAYSAGAESIALVGHEPFMGALAGLLLGGAAAPSRLRFRKGAVAVLTVERDLPAGSATLEALVAPSLLRR